MVVEEDLAVGAGVHQEHLPVDLAWVLEEFLALLILEHVVVSLALFRHRIRV